MKKYNALYFLYLLPFLLWAQTPKRVQVEGLILSEKNDVEGVTIFNISTKKGTISDGKGEFKLLVAEHDIIEISALQFQVVTIEISAEVIISKSLKIQLLEQVNQLKEVLVGKVLTGDLNSDIKNIEGKPPINFYDLGIPGYKGKPATQSERRLSEAGEFKPAMLMGLLGGGLPLNPIINGISGRTKMLKNRVDIESREQLMHSIKARLGKDLFASNPLEVDLQTDFFYFCADDEHFIWHCNNQTDFYILTYLKKKYKQYQANRINSKD